MQDVWNKAASAKVVPRTRLSVKAYATIPIGTMSSTSLAFLCFNGETAWINMFGCFFMSHWDFLSFKQATLNHYPYYISRLSRMLLRLSKTTILEAAVCRLTIYSSQINRVLSNHLCSIEHNSFVVTTAQEKMKKFPNKVIITHRKGAK